MINCGEKSDRFKFELSVKLCLQVLFIAQKSNGGPSDTEGSSTAVFHNQKQQSPKAGAYFGYYKNAEGKVKTEKKMP